MVEWGHNGRILTLSPLMPWYIDSEREADGSLSLPAFSPEERANILKDFQGVYGDRRQELVLIGIHLNQMKISKALDACLLTDQEFEIFERIVEPSVTRTEDAANGPSSSLALVSAAAANVFYDPLPTWTMPLDDETTQRTPSLVWLLRCGQGKRFQILDANLLLRLTQVNLHLNASAAAMSIDGLSGSAALRLDLSRLQVKLWLTSLVRQRTKLLVATLRPFVHESERLEVVVTAVPVVSESPDEEEPMDEDDEAAGDEEHNNEGTTEDGAIEEDVWELSMELQYAETNTFASLLDAASSSVLQKQLSLLYPFIELYLHAAVELTPEDARADNAGQDGEAMEENAEDEEDQEDEEE
jgi:hypothetical protein